MHEMYQKKVETFFQEVLCTDFVLFPHDYRSINASGCKKAFIFHDYVHDKLNVNLIDY